jgi:hypothetical protein
MTPPDVWQLHPLATNVGRQAIVGYEVEALDGVPVLTTGLGLALARVAKHPPRRIVRDTGVVLAGRTVCGGRAPGGQPVTRKPTVALPLLPVHLRTGDGGKMRIAG